MNFRTKNRKEIVTTENNRKIKKETHKFNRKTIKGQVIIYSYYREEQKIITVFQQR